jgi:hypothetical protein
MLDHRRLAMGKPGAIERSLEDHRRIVAALKARDPKAVSAAFSRHILRIHDTSRAVDVGAGIAGTLWRLCSERWTQRPKRKRSDMHMLVVGAQGAPGRTLASILLARL